MHSRYSELTTEDSGLTAQGWEQTNILAAWLAKHEKVELLISAPQLRSRLTAQRIGQAIGRPVIVQQDCPHHPRVFPQSPTFKLEAGFRLPPLHIHEQFASPATYHEFAQRMTTVLERLIQEHAGKTVAIVMDGNGVATVLRCFLGGTNISIAVSHTSISEITWHNGQWSLLYANRMEHDPLPPFTKVEVQSEQNGVDDAKAMEEELNLIAQIYNRILSTGSSFHDQSRDQRLRHLLKFANLAPGLRVLDVGTGNGRLAMLLAEEGAREVVGVDISPAMLEVAEYLRVSGGAANGQRVNYRLAAAQGMPFRNEGFDAVTCRLVLHHTHKPDEILREIHRLLKPGGVLIVADLLAADDPVKRATQNTIEARRNPAHVSMYTADQYRKLVTNAGLVIEGEATAVFERELDDWLNDLQSDPASRSVVREMVEAGLETDATGFKVRQQANKLVLDQRIFYMKAVKR